jgi:hypothetical protein
MTTAAQLVAGPQSNLKTVIETGEPLPPIV